MKKYLRENILFILGTIFVFWLFYYMCSRTPLAGDDWGYYLSSLDWNPIQGAYLQYFSWSGRFFSEMWGFFMPAHKEVWNIVNPLLFTGIFICIYLIVKPEKNKIIAVLFILATMLSVDENLRMETYTWIMGSTYIVPLFLSLLYFLSIKNLIEKEKINKSILYVNNLCLIIIGLMMENIAATMIGAIIILIIYCYVKNKKYALKYLIVNLIVSIIAFTIMRLSPGSAYRLQRDNQDWLNATLFEKISGQYHNFIYLTFIANDYMIMLFSVALSTFVLFSKKIKNWQKVIHILINAIGTITVFSFVLIKDNMFINPDSLYSKLFWPIYIINAFIAIWYGSEDNNRRNKTIFMLIIGGASSLVMLYSPTFGSRSVIYTVYYIIVVSLLLLEEVDLKKLSIVCGIVLLLIIGDRTKELVTKFDYVKIAQEKREEIATYYREHPEDVEAWFPRFPMLTIHGADIEIGDEFHFQQFTKYYKLPQIWDRIVFYTEE